jgi:hypothetical protein
MLESCARFQSQSREVLAHALTQLVTDIRKVLIHPDLGNDGKIAALFSLVDAVAPPPEADEEGESGTGEGLVPPAGTTVTRSPVPS